jgi:hypothetical protein
MRQYRAAKILLARRLLIPPAAAAPAAAVGTDRGVGSPEAMESIPGCAIWALRPRRSVHKLDGAREVVDKPEAVAAAA